MASALPGDGGTESDSVGIKIGPSVGVGPRVAGGPRVGSGPRIGVRGRPSTGRAAGGAGPKGQAIAQAALRLFLAEGYERTSVDAIAAEAGVSKRTIYNRYGDKETLFLTVLRETFATMLATFRRIADEHFPGVPLGGSDVPPGNNTDLERDLTAFVLEATLTLTVALDRVALLRLILTEAPFFPALMRDEVGQEGMLGTLARVLAQPALAGRLAISNFAEAAEHLFALTFAAVNNRALFQRGRLPEAETTRIVTSGVRVFLRAYRAD
jgi:TetR/AcrR family transcriptional regulator, mexJK operon transcriptional repressor